MFEGKSLEVKLLKKKAFMRGKGKESEMPWKKEIQS